MSPRVRCKDSIGVWAVAALVPLVLTLASYAQCCSSGGCSSRGPEKRSYGGGGGSDTLSTPEPYAGQVFCPVTGEKLGLRGPAVPVQTAIGEKKPSFFGKLTGKKPTPGAVVYVCCPACVAKVQSNPSTYLGEVIADKACFAYTYASAPAQRPARVNTALAWSPDIPATETHGRQKTCPVSGEQLGSMGAPVPVTVNGQTIYVCCQSCVGKVQRDPDTYLAKVAAEGAPRQSGRP